MELDKDDWHQCIPNRYARLSKTQVKELLGWMHGAAITTYRNDEGTVWNSQYNKFRKYYYSLKEFAKEQKIDAIISDCPRGYESLSFDSVVYYYLYPGISHPLIASEQVGLAHGTTIILDIPYIHYHLTIMRAAKSGVKRVIFLCGSHQSAHLSKILREMRISTRFLDIPVKEWKDWKEMPEYERRENMLNINNYSRNSLKVLVADDDIDSAKRVQQVLQSGGYRNVKTVSKVRALKELEGYDLVIIDVIWTKKNSKPEHEISENFGIASLRYLKSNNPQTLVVFMSASLFDLSDIISLANADGHFKSSIEGSEILEQISKVLSDKRIKLLNLLEQTLLDGQANSFGLETQTYEKLLYATQQAKQNSQAESQSSGWINFKQALTTFSPLLTGSNALIGIVNGLIKLISGE
jgi:CheY-like chemotaxis protein